MSGAPLATRIIACKKCALCCRLPHAQSTETCMRACMRSCLLPREYCSNATAGMVFPMSCAGSSAWSGTHGWARHAKPPQHAKTACAFSFSHIIMNPASVHECTRRVGGRFARLGWQAFRMYRPTISQSAAQSQACPQRFKNSGFNANKSCAVAFHIINEALA